MWARLPFRFEFERRCLQLWRTIIIIHKYLLTHGHLVLTVFPPDLIQLLHSRPFFFLGDRLLAHRQDGVWDLDCLKLFLSFSIRWRIIPPLQTHSILGLKVKWWWQWHYSASKLKVILWYINFTNRIFNISWTSSRWNKRRHTSLSFDVFTPWWSIYLRSKEGTVFDLCVQWNISPFRMQVIKRIVSFNHNRRMVNGSLSNWQSCSTSIIFVEDNIMIIPLRRIKTNKACNHSLNLFQILCTLLFDNCFFSVALCLKLFCHYNANITLLKSLIHYDFILLSSFHLW